MSKGPVWIVVFCIATVLALSGCVREVAVDPLPYRVYLPLAAHDCTAWICGEVMRREAILLCRAEMVRLRNEGQRTQQPDDCADENLGPFGWTP